MDLSEFFRKEHLTVDEVRSLGGSSTPAVILGEEWLTEQVYNNKPTKTMFIKVQLSKTKEIRPLRLGTKGTPSVACRNLRQLYGSNTDLWAGEIITLFPVRYGEDKFTLGVKAFDIEVEKID